MIRARGTGGATGLRAAGLLVGCLSAVAGGCGDEGGTGPGGGPGGGDVGSSTGGGAQPSSSSGDGGSTGHQGGGGGEGGEGGEGGATTCDSSTALATGPAALGGTLVVRAPLATGLGDPALPDVVDVGYAFESGTFDLANAINDNLATCAQCVLVLEDLDASGAPARAYYPSSGVLVVEPIDAFPYATIGLAGVTLVEVTLDDEGVSSAVEGGACVTLDGETLEVEVGDAWTCAPASFADGVECNCGCGAYDPDCADPDIEPWGCGPGATCSLAGACTVPSPWTCDEAAWDDGAVCDCGCGWFDPDCGVPGLPTPGCGEDQVCVSDACADVVPNDTCEAAIVLGEGTVEGAWAGSADDYTPGRLGASCTGSGAPGEDVAYAIPLSAGQTVFVELDPDAIDAALYLVTDCGDAASTCVDGSDQAGFDGAEHVEHEATEDVILYAIVDHADPHGGEGSFSLTVAITP